MLISEFITFLRRRAEDIPTLNCEVFDTDGIAVAFRLKETPVVGAVTIKYNDIVQVEGVDYTLDRDSGLIIFTTAPAVLDNGISASYYYAKLSDASWLSIINAVLGELRDKLWEDKTDSTTHTTVSNQSDYDLNGISTRIFKVVGVWVRQSTSSDWSSLSNETNVNYWREQNLINLRPYFPYSGWLMKIRYLEYYGLYTAVGDTVTVDTKYHETIAEFAMARYMDKLMSIAAKNAGFKAQDETMMSVENMLNIKNSFLKQAERMLGRVKPRLPATLISTIISGIKD